MHVDILRSIDVFLAGASRPLIVILGPTASGKTGFSIELAKHIDGEIINADSRQLYRSLNLGTAKVTQEEMDGVPHHLIDVLDPKEEATVGWYQVASMKAIDDIIIRRRVPILAGGSMLYLSSVIDGLSLGPPSDPAVRGRLEKTYERDGGEKLYRLLCEVDPEAAAAIHPRNKAYVVRALEIYETLQQPKSKVIEQKKCSYDLLIFGLERSRDELRKHIAERLDRMFQSGWIDEVRELLRKGYRSEDPGMKSTGYREIIQYLGELESGVSSEDSDEMLLRLKAKILAKTCQYAKRQMTWWRNDPRIHWINV